MTLEEKYDLALGMLHSIYHNLTEQPYDCAECEEEHSEYILDTLKYDELEAVLFELLDEEDELAIGN